MPLDVDPTRTVSPSHTSVAQLMDDLKSDDVAARVESVQRLHTIALALGPERCRTELLPFIKDGIGEEDDEVQAVMAVQLNGAFLTLLGGQQYLDLMMPIVEVLLGSEESVVRQGAVASIRDILETVDDKTGVCQNIMFPLFERLTAVDEWFSKKTCAAQIAPIIMHYLNGAQKTVMLNVFTNSLLSDDNPIVRRAALTACKVIFTTTETVDWMAWLEAVQLLIDDPQDSVRLLVADPIAAIGKHLPNSDQQSVVFPLVMRLIGDNSWRVRYMAASAYADLMLAIGLNVPDFSPMLAFSGLLTDYEAEVRIAAAGHVAAVAQLWPTPTTFTDGLLPVLQKTVIDPNPAVRAAVALQLNELSAVAGEEATMRDLLPLFLQLFQDDSSQVRLNVISRLDVINKVIGVEHLSQALVPAIVKLAQDRQWLVRQAIIDYIPVVCEHLGSDFYDQHLLSLTVAFLDDPVYAVRVSAMVMFKRVGVLFGADHFAKSILPRCQSLLSAHQNYLRRMCYLMFLRECRETVSAVDRHLWYASVELMSRDAVANVRLNVAKTCRVLPGCEQILERLRKDGDEDVVFAAAHY